MKFMTNKLQYVKKAKLAVYHTEIQIWHKGYLSKHARSTSYNFSQKRAHRKSYTEITTGIKYKGFEKFKC